MLRAMGDAEFAHVYKCAQCSVYAWGDATHKHGSLLQNWICGKEVREDERYPDPDVLDRRHGYQFFYHSHRHATVEHGHLHLFYHATISGNRRYVREGKPWKRTAPSHLFAISLDSRGLPVGLFTVNHWVTNGHWLSTSTILATIKRFRFQIEGEHSVSAEWLTGFIGMYVPIIENLLHRRDTTLSNLAKAIGISQSLEDHQHEVLSVVKIDWMHDIQVLEKEWERRKMTCFG
ncbi:conserved hypothetical protein [Candidatus Nitrotoga sp. M5]|nr:conserved hypothetical protein [Candidatus Nitrotoga sp. M5]